jgi:hypothetical protein
MAEHRGPVRRDWELFDAAGLQRTGIREQEARDLVIINADPVVYVKHYVTEVEVRWSDVCAEPWPDPDRYGDSPPDWPYGNGC